jgi:Family of unknown function (DUF5681)
MTEDLKDDVEPERPEVGYKKPPVHTRFRPGQSGNPRGREKGLRNLSVDVKRMLHEPIKISIGGKERRVSSQEGALKRLREKAFKGDARALDRFFALAQTHNGDDLAGASAGMPLADDDQAILDAYAHERARENSAGTKIGEAALPEYDESQPSREPD